MAWGGLGDGCRKAQGMKCEMNALCFSYRGVNGLAFLQLSWPTTKTQHDPPPPSQSKQHSSVVKLARKIQIS